jgi:hypothetical protein
MQLRAQMLRIEQEKELMRVKLEEEVAEREKAQKQARQAGGGGPCVKVRPAARLGLARRCFWPSDG